MSVPRTAGGDRSVDRRAVRSFVARAAGGLLAVGLVYGLLPVDSGGEVTSVLAVVAGLLALGALLIVHVRRILTGSRPVLRATEALATVVPLFVVVFAWSYVLLSRADPGSFNEPLDRIAALYFAVTVLSTVGFGDIVPESGLARLMVTGQIVLNLTLLVAVIRFIVLTARAGWQRQQEEPQRTPGQDPAGPADGVDGNGGGGSTG